MNAPATKRVRKDAVTTTRVLINKTGKEVLLSNDAENWLRENGYGIEAEDSTSRRHDDGGYEQFLPAGVFQDADDLAEADDDGGEYPVGTGRVMTDDDHQSAMDAWGDSIEPASWDSWRHSPALLACFDALGAAMTPPREDFPGIIAPVTGRDYEFTSRPRQRLAVVKVTGRYYRVEAGPAGEIVVQPPDEQAGWSPDEKWSDADQAAGKVWIDLTRSGTDLRGGALLTYNRNRQLVRLVDDDDDEDAGVIPLNEGWLSTIDAYTDHHDLFIGFVWEVEDLLTPRGEEGEPCPTVFRTKETDLTYEEALGILKAARSELSESARKHGRRIIKRHYRAFIANRTSEGASE